MRASIVICTHDRGDVVASAVEPALAQAQAAGGEVIVVDNASTDDTPAILAALARRLGGPLRIVSEPQLGLSAARNRGLAEARGAVVAYLDDDAVPHAGWLDALLRPYADPAVACVGGRIVLRFPGPPPRWLSPDLYSQLSAFDLGDEPRQVRYGKANYPYGANISFRVERARALGGFSTTVGPRGRHQLVHDETDLCYRLEHAGGVIRYAPDAVVDHCVLTERLTPQWMLERAWTGGLSAAVFILRNRRLLRALWRIWWLYRGALASRPYALHDPIDPDRFARECRRREALGYVVGLARAVPHLRTLRAA
jgi:glycosyltransferase involved in cell wall biosynthesis